MARSSADEAWDALYEAPLDQFIARRTELAKKLDGEAAEALRKARRPPLSAWAVNQVVREQPQTVEELFEAGQAMHRIQAELLKGGDADAFRAASERLHAIVRRLTEAAGKLVAAAGHPDSSSLLGKIERTLFTGATGEEPVRAALKAGRLSADLNPGDPIEHGGFTGPAPAIQPKQPKAKDDKEARKLESEAEDLDREATAAEKRADALDKKARDAEEEARQASQRAQDARWKAGEARSQASDARARAREAGLRAGAARAKLN